jgi:3'(2'), 5'-bisphosphate nucleotidase
MRDELLGACSYAAQVIMKIYGTDFEVRDKADASPVTDADMAAHDALCKMLPIIKDLPIVSEEDGARHAHDRYWLIDPLDGTKEFIKRNGEFTVNVALMDDGVPVAGMVQLPEKGVAYYGDANGAWRREFRGEWLPIAATPPAGALTAAVSRSHRGTAVDAYLRNLRAAGHEVNETSAGSSLKLCQVAEGSAHVYPRMAPTMPWDIAAAHAVCTAAGAVVTDLDGVELRYDDPNRLNPWFIVGCPGLAWHDFAKGIKRV